MKASTRGAVCAGLLAAWLSPAMSALVVEKVEPGSAAEAAGLQAGDRLLAWRSDRPEATGEGELESPFELHIVEIEAAPLARITLVGRRAGADLSAVMPQGRWGLSARPDPPEGLPAADPQDADPTALAAAATSADDLTAAWLLFRAAERLLEAQDWNAARSRFDEAAARAGAADLPAIVAVLRESQGDLLRAASRHDDARSAYAAALDRSREISEDGLAVASALFRLGDLALLQGDLESALADLERSLEIRERRVPESLDTARTLNKIGYAVLRRLGPGDLERTLEYQQRALAIQQELAPGGLDVASSYNHLGIVALRRQDLGAAEEHFAAALAIRERLAPDSMTVASTLGNLGNVAWNRGNYALAGEYFQRALVIRERLSPDGLDVSNSLNGLGGVAFMRGDLAATEAYLRRSVAIRERLAPGSDRLGIVLSNLGTVALKRGDLDAAEAYFRRSLEIRESLAPDSLEVGWRLDSLGHVALRRGDLDLAEERLRRALAIKQAVAPDTLHVAHTWNAMGDLARERRDLAEAEASYRKALEIRERLAPQGLLVATTLSGLGRVAAERGEDASSEKLHRRALEIRERIAPGTADEAESAAALAALLRLEHAEEAVGLYYRAVDALEAQQGKLGGDDEVRTSFRSAHMDIYRELIDLLVELGREAEALHVLERSRARGLLSLLAERDLVFTADVPERLDARRRMLATEYERTQSSLAKLSAEKDADKIAEVTAKLASLRRDQAEVREEIRRSSPRLAALQNPEPLDLGGVRRTLDPGTVALSYNVGAAGTHLFVVGTDGSLQAFRLAPGESELRDRVEGYRRAIQGSGDTGEDPARRLFQMLIAPAAAVIEPASRLLIIPDGPLHLLPFGALMDTDPADPSRDRYLIEWKPLHFAASFTVFAELRATRGARSGDRLAAFGDPLYRTTTSGTGASLKPLPASREEVTAIATLFGADSRAWLGAEATEGRARSSSTARWLHFAAHGVVDERVPLDSAIALSTPESVEFGRDNGFLQAWEIFESMRIDADLVTLSGCETALGREMAGEGIVGLTRAFQYAGARSVLASLWSVADRSTAELMKLFYGRLRDGMPKDQALQAAQVALIRSARGSVDGDGDTRGVKGLARTTPEAGSFASPFYWGAFQLIGDWR